MHPDPLLPRHETRTLTPEELDECWDNAPVRPRPSLLARARRELRLMWDAINSPLPPTLVVIGILLGMATSAWVLM